MKSRVNKEETTRKLGQGGMQHAGCCAQMQARSHAWHRNNFEKIWKRASKWMDDSTSWKKERGNKGEKWSHARTFGQRWYWCWYRHRRLVGRRRYHWRQRWRLFQRRQSIGCSSQLLLLTPTLFHSRPPQRGNLTLQHHLAIPQPPWNILQTSSLLQRLFTFRKHYKRIHNALAQ